ncbi:Nn.00g024600.m01.CDS01 [Neocucurbitaria sp. VM-36]
MADPFSITAGIVSITVPALHGIRLLLDDLQQLKDAPKTVKRLVEDVRSVDTALLLLQGVESEDCNLLGGNVAQESSVTSRGCTQVCDLFRSDLQRWIRHSEDGKLGWKDRTRVGVFKQGQVKAMSEQLQNCKLAINSIVRIATLYSSVRHSHVTEEIKNTIFTKQAEVESAISTTDKQLVLVDNKLKELNLSSDDDEAAGTEEGRNEALRQLEEKREAVTASRRLLEELLSRAQEEAVSKAAAKDSSSSTTVTFGNQN